MHEHIEELYRLYYYELYAFLFKRCPDVDIVDDLIQNTFLEALKSIDNFKGESSVKTWLFGIAKHQLYRHFRKNKKQFPLDELSDAELATQTSFSDKLFVQHILETVSSLSPPLDEIMRLRLVYGMPFKEIGLRVQRSENYCRVNFYRIKERLRKEFGHEPM